MQIKKIKNKKVKLVVAQKNCSRPGYSIKYKGAGDCLNDCIRADKPRYYASTHY